jgi:hypothetical protein
MAMLMVLLAAAEAETAWGPDALRRLSELGVTEMSVLRDDDVVGVLLDGWAFDPARSRDDAVAVVAAAGPAQVLVPVLHAAVMPPAGAARE